MYISETCIKQPLRGVELRPVYRGGWPLNRGLNLYLGPGQVAAQYRWSLVAFITGPLYMGTAVVQVADATPEIDHF